ncbi:hypothetical protein N7462_000844 [Penicillium macrosclerotiorum]|uniref:uncharacterized protein n=1 Tax=Penicillium macrosclerotiorum TaxID=303699 RepID=UPI0025478A1B|nr:uncharacterized protein N7462_000844 [Penicillium macrosclerotiorum]KAJ5698839.1 hypothetical protein N7462_000844 [Penicillium macrosclerotiorum]
MDKPCRCSTEALQIMSDLQNVHAVIDAETVLGLVNRVCHQGMLMVHCEDCTKELQYSVVTLPTLSEQCLPLLEALCSAYDITSQPSFFDTAMLTFDPPASHFICVRSKVIFGQTELDEAEIRLLVRTLLGRNLMRLVELMEGLKGILPVLSEGPSTHRNGSATLKACESSLESIIGRLAVLVQIIQGDSDNDILT